MFDINDFNFDAMKEAVGVDPFAQNAEKFAEDARFYKLGKDKDGNGGALIRFLPDINKGTIQQVYKINTTIEKNGKKRFVNEYSPSTIGLPCPFQEEWQRLWNAGQKEEAKKYGRTVRYIANIKVLKDPANPDNEGKIFLLDMSGSLKDKLQKALELTPTDIQLGKEAKQVFNPFKGNSFLLQSQRGSNGMINYDASEIKNEVNSIYDSIEAGIEDIKNNTYSLSEFRDANSFLSYDKLVEKLKYVTFANATNAPEVQAVPAVQTTELVANVTAPAQVQPVAEVQAPVTQSTQPTLASTNIDDLLAGLTN